MTLREQLDAQLMWGNEAQDRLSDLDGVREDARLYNVARKEALAERDEAWAALRDRRCKDCALVGKHCEPYRVWGCVHPDFACNRWTERITP